MSTEEPSLDIVKEEDKIMVIDVLRVIKQLNICQLFEVKQAARGYEILCWVNTTTDVDIGYDELGLIDQLNDTRIKLVGLRVFADTNKICLRVRIISMSEPAMINDNILIRVKKRSRWWNGES